MKHGHLTEQRKHFVEAYCRLGNGTLAAKEAGYKGSPSLVNQASKLKRELSAERLTILVISYPTGTRVAQIVSFALCMHHK